MERLNQEVPVVPSYDDVETPSTDPVYNRLVATLHEAHTELTNIMEMFERAEVSDSTGDVYSQEIDIISRRIQDAEAALAKYRQQ